MLIFPYSVYRSRNPSRREGFLSEVCRLAALDTIKRHSLTDSPDHADVVLITEAQSHLDTWNFSAIRSDPLVRRWKEKAFVYCDADHPVCVLPGLYPSVPQTWRDRSSQLGFPYIGLSAQRQTPTVDDETKDLLFSFSGQIQNHSCRHAIRSFQHPRMEVVDTSGKYHFALNPSEMETSRSRYQRQMERSKFVLCPRGVGASSYRLFEAMAAGCVPVIISDAWVEPPGIDWASFSVRVPEKQARTIPELLEGLEQNARTMRMRGQEVFRNYLSDGTLFNYLGDCLQLLSTIRRTQPKSFPARRWLAFGSVGISSISQSTKHGLKRMLGRVKRRANIA